MSKLVDLTVQLDAGILSVEATEMEITKETEKMYIVTGGWRKRVDKYAIRNIKTVSDTVYYIKLEAIVPLEEKESTLKLMKKELVNLVKSMQENLTLQVNAIKGLK